MLSAQHLQLSSAIRTSLSPSWLLIARSLRGLITLIRPGVERVLLKVLWVHGTVKNERYLNTEEFPSYE